MPPPVVSDLMSAIEHDLVQRRAKKFSNPDIPSVTVIRTRIVHSEINPLRLQRDITSLSTAVDVIGDDFSLRIELGCRTNQAGTQRGV